ASSSEQARTSPRLEPLDDAVAISLTNILDVKLYASRSKVLRLLLRSTVRSLVRQVSLTLRLTLRGRHQAQVSLDCLVDSVDRVVRSRVSEAVSNICRSV